MAVRPNILSICTGAGGLDLGVRFACPDTCTVCYVEREAFAVANLVAAIQEGLMDDAPVWSDLATFDGGPWRGTVDWLIGGIPCQPHSVAGQRQGVDDERDLWPDAARIIREVGPSVVFLENVPGIAGYYHERIGPELRGMGYATQEGLFSADEVGAPHFRQRFFVLGYTDGARLASWGSQTDLELGRRPLQERRRKSGRNEFAPPDDAVGHTEPQHLGVTRRGMAGKLLPQGGRGEGTDGIDPPSGELANAGCGRRGSIRTDFEPPYTATRGPIGPLADSDGLNGCICLRAGQSRDTEPETGRSGTDIPDTHCECTEGVHVNGWQGTGFGLQIVFPPAPNDHASWARLLAEVPSIEPAFCREADGVAWWLDATTDRAHRLRVLGNGVVPLVAGHAFRTLAARAGLEV